MSNTETVFVERATIADKRKDGTPYISSKGKPFSMCFIKVRDGRSLSKLIFSEEDKAECDKLSGETELQVSQNGKYWNFELPGKPMLKSKGSRTPSSATANSSMASSDKEDILKRLSVLEARMRRLDKLETPTADGDEVVESVDDLPF